MAGKPAPGKERAWTETELKYLALVLADEKNQFAVRLETLALKKSANNYVFEDISKVFQSCLLSIDFIEETCIIRPVSTGRTMRRTYTVLYSSSRIYTIY